MDDGSLFSVNHHDVAFYRIIPCFSFCVLSFDSTIMISFSFQKNIRTCFVTFLKIVLKKQRTQKWFTLKFRAFMFLKIIFENIEEFILMFSGKLFCYLNLLLFLFAWNMLFMFFRMYLAHSVFFVLCFRIKKKIGNLGQVSFFFVLIVLTKEKQF